jgi:ribosome modulation factor
MDSAGVAARPRAVRLDELPAEVPAEEVCWPPLRFTTQWLQFVFKRGQLVQVLQACALQLIEQSAHWHGGWTQAFTLRTVCRRALHFDMWRIGGGARRAELVACHK